jgi:hypothetical protein
MMLAAALLIATVRPALCGAVTDFLKFHDEPLGQVSTETEIMGIQKGFIEADAFLAKTRKEAPMYCQPETLSLNADQLVDMLRRGVKDDPDLDQGNVASALLAVLRHTFPCPEGAK